MDALPAGPERCLAKLDGNAVAAHTLARDPTRRRLDAASAHRFAGMALRDVALSAAGRTARGEATVTSYGLEGGAVYVIAAAVRDALAAGPVALSLDLRPDLTAHALARKLDRPQGRQSLSSHLKRMLNLAPVAIALLHEAHGRSLPNDPAALAARIKGAAADGHGDAGAGAGDLDRRRHRAAGGGRARCWTGRRRPAATSSRRRSRPPSPPQTAPSPGWRAASRDF
jgi:hypothetical protein